MELTGDAVEYRAPAGRPDPGTRREPGQTTDSDVEVAA